MIGVDHLPLQNSAPEGPVLVMWGGGVNSTALLVYLHSIGRRPAGVVMSDPGSEWPETHAYRAGVMGPWLHRIGWPPIEVISKSSVATRGRRETLLAQCIRTRTLPSIAYGHKKCSLKFKRAPVNTWANAQGWCRAAWDRGEKVVKAIGYDADESRRARRKTFDGREARKFVPWYPLFDAFIDRDDCLDLIRSAGLALPQKSACTFCPSNTDADWRRLQQLHPQRFAEALAMEANAEIDKPEVVGLRRRGRVGGKSLIAWSRAQNWPEDAFADQAAAIACECGL